MGQRETERERVKERQRERGGGRKAEKGGVKGMGVKQRETGERERGKETQR